MNTLIRPASAFLRSSGVGMKSSLGGHGQHLREGRALRASGWISPRLRSVIHLHGSTPRPKSPGRCQVHERGHTGSPPGQTRPCAARSARARRDDGNSGAASGAGRLNCSNAGLAFRKRLAGDCQQCHALLYGLNNFGHGLRGPCRAGLRGQGLKRRVTTATPTLREGAGQEGLGSL